jgi:anti-sigma factor RsiW
MTYRHTSHLHGDYLDGDLSPGASETVERHVESCAQCREDIERSRRLKHTLRQIEVPDPGNDYFEDLSDAIVARTSAMIPQEASPKPAIEPDNTGRQVLKTLIKLAMAVTFLFLAFYISDFNQEKQATRWADKIRQGNFVTSGQISPEESLMYPPAGIDMSLGLPTLIVEDEEPPANGVNLE